METGLPLIECYIIYSRRNVIKYFLKKKYDMEFSLSNSRRHSVNANVIADVKSNIIVPRQQFFADVIFSATSKVQNHQKKPEKIPCTHTINAYYIFQGISNIFSNIYALLFIFNKL